MELVLHTNPLMYYTGSYKENVIRAGEPIWIFCIGMLRINLKRLEVTARARVRLPQAEELKK